MTPASAVREGDWKLIHYYEDDRAELFNLADDVSEKRDLAGENPGKANELREKLDAWREATGANSPTKNPNS